MYLIVLNDFVSLKNSFFMSLKIILTCVHEMLCYFTETKDHTNYTCNLLFFFLLVLDVKAISNAPYNRGLDAPENVRAFFVGKQ